MTEQHSRKILLAVSGMSPQIITETMYALIRGQSWIPHEVRLITTEQGRKNAVLQLLEGNQYFQKLLDDYGVMQPVTFSEQHIRLIQDNNGNALSDLRTPEENEAAADTISAVIRELTQDENTELHVSLAGGRKTMGFYAGYALSLFGRPQDRLSHVLVSAEYESLPDFFYPTPESRLIRNRQDQRLDASNAKVWLAEIPFVRLRNRLPKTLLKGTHSFSEAVQLAREATENVQMVLHPKDKSYSVNGRSGTLSALHTALLSWAVIRALENQVPIATSLLDVEQERIRFASEVLEVADRYWLVLPDKTEELLKQSGMTKQWLEQTVTRLNSEIAKTLGDDLAKRCKLASQMINGQRGYALPEDLILSIEEPDD